MPRAEPTSPSATVTWRVWRSLFTTQEWASIADLRDDVELSRPTIQAALAVLTGAGWLESRTLASQSGRGGRPAEVFRVRRDAWHAVAARISGHEVVACVLNSVGEEVARETVQIESPERVSETLVVAARAAIGRAGVARVERAVVATIGICRVGVVVTSHLFGTLEGDGARRRCEEALGFPVWFENDAKLAGVAQLEALHDPDPQLILVAIHLDAAPGCAIIVNNSLVDGAHGAAGELAYSAGLGWGDAERHLVAVAARRGLTPQEVFALSSAGDSWAAGVMAELADLLTHGVLCLILALDPHVLSVGGPGGVDASPLVVRLVKNLESQVPVMPRVELLSDPECVLTGAKSTATAHLEAARSASLFGAG